MGRHGSIDGKNRHNDVAPAAATTRKRTRTRTRMHSHTTCEDDGDEDHRSGSASGGGKSAWYPTTLPHTRKGNVGHRLHRRRIIPLLAMGIVVLVNAACLSRFAPQSYDSVVEAGAEARAAPRGRLFYCGYKFPLVEHVFPGYEFVGNKPWALEDSGSEDTDTNHDNDILVVGLWGPSCNDDEGDERTSFSGKILYVNGESHGNPVSNAWWEWEWDNENGNGNGGSNSNSTDARHRLDKIFQLGPYPVRQDDLSPKDRFYNEHSLGVFQMAVALLGNVYLPKKLSVELDPADVNPFLELKDEEESATPQKTNAVSFDGLKQLAEGNGYGEGYKEPYERIPAAVYVSRNCVGFRQSTAELLAKTFPGPNAGVQGGERDQSGDRHRGLLDGSEVPDNDFAGLHARAVALNRKNQSTGLLDDRIKQHLQAIAERETSQDEVPDSGVPHSKQEDTDSVDALSEHRRETDETSFLHYGGECTVDGGIPVPEDALELEWRNNDRTSFRTNYLTIYTRYKYCLVMENTLQEGYVTEKLLYGLLGGCLPIYYGSREVYDIFRADSFVYLDPYNPETGLAEIERLEQNPDEYARRTDRSRPLLKAGKDGTTLDTLDRYFSLLPDIGTGKLCRELHERMGLPVPEGLAPEAPRTKSWVWW